jgi:hypothetical protein
LAFAQHCRSPTQIFHIGKLHWHERSSCFFKTWCD